MTFRCDKLEPRLSVWNRVVMTSGLQTDGTSCGSFTALVSWNK